MSRHGVSGIFGEQVVDAELDTSSCAWTVKTPDGRVLMQVPWRWAYDQTGLGPKRPRRQFLTNDEFVAHASRWEAFEMCMCAYPLTADNKLALEARFPGITSNTAYVVSNPVWIPDAPPAPRPRPRNPTPRPTPATVDVLDTPATSQETSHEAGERKLLL